MEHEEVHGTFPPTIAGLKIAIDVTLGLRRCGFKTRLVERTICGFPVISVLAVPPARPNRKDRGCDVR